MPIRVRSYKNKDKARVTRNAQRLRYYQKTQLYPDRRRWTREEDIEVLKHSITDTELSYLIHRSVQSIQIRRNKLKAKQTQKNNRE